MDLLRDIFAEAIAPLRTQGWVINEYGRYDPTYVVGLTPSGRSFRLDCVDNTVTITVAGRTRTVNIAKDSWMQGNDTVARWLQAWQALPANQR